MDANTLIYDIRSCDNFKRGIQEALSKIEKKQRGAKIESKSSPNKLSSSSRLHPKIAKSERDSSNTTWKILLFVLIAIVIIIIVIVKIP